LNGDYASLVVKTEFKPSLKGTKGDLNGTKGDLNGKKMPQF